MSLPEFQDFSDTNYTDYGNGTNDTLDYDIPEAPMWASYIVQVLYAIVCIVGLGGNTLVIYVVVRFSKMQTVTNLYIVNLAIADELFLIGIPFLISTMNLGYWPFGKIACKAFYTSTSINQITSSMFLLIMSADRYENLDYYSFVHVPLTFSSMTLSYGLFASNHLVLILRSHASPGPLPSLSFPFFSRLSSTYSHKQQKLDHQTSSSSSPSSSSSSSSESVY